MTSISKTIRLHTYLKMIKVADNLEIYEDNNNHIEEFNEDANGEHREENENMSD